MFLQADGLRKEQQNPTKQIHEGLITKLGILLYILWFVKNKRLSYKQYNNIFSLCIQGFNNHE